MEFRFEQESGTVGQLIAAVAEQLAHSELWYGHGTDNPEDEAAWLVFSVCGIDYPVPEGAYDRSVSTAQLQRVRSLLKRRINERQPVPYLINEAWFAGQRFYVDERVLIPRSPFAELILAGFSPWADKLEPKRILEIGTGSGCIAIACALAFPDAEVVATDISADALAVAGRNVAGFELTERVELRQADLFGDVTGQFDLIVTNPPYVPTEEMRELPDEYAHEPALALVSGDDGLDAARRILTTARSYLRPDGLLFIEVGLQWPELDAAFPDLPLTWLEFEHGGEGIAMIAAQDLPAVG